MGKLIDLTGQQFGDWLVLGRGEDVPDGKNKKPGWKCQCLKCGKIKNVNGKNLRAGLSTSCGCTRGGKLFKDEIGNTYGLLTVIKREPNNSRGQTFWLCKCKCGAKTVVSGNNLRNGNTKSCGCLDSLGELELSQLLQKFNINFVKQYSFPDLYYTSESYPLRFDIGVLNKKDELVFLIEYQGIQHYKNMSFGQLQRETTDQMKINYCLAHNIKLKFISYKENVEEKLISFLQEENML